jgi:M6 family metalloprotease-like protein
MFFALVASLMSASPNLHAQEDMCGCNLSGLPASPPPDSLRLGVILVQFSDWATNTDARGGVCQIHPSPQNLDDYTYQMYYDQLLSTNYRTAPPYGKKTHDNEDLFGSMKDFYKDVSYGKFAIRANSDIINPHPNPNATPTFVTLRQTKSWWAGQMLTSESSKRLLDSTLAVSGYSISGYDKIAIIYAGNNPGGGLQATANSSTRFVYQVAEKGLGERGRTQTPGTFQGMGIHSHEFGHLLGLPDLKVDLPGIPWRGGVREFALMATGNQGFMDGSTANTTIGGGHAPTPLSGWSKLWLTWANYTEIAADGPINFPSLDADDNVYVRFINDADHSDWDEGEYFIIENRRPLFSNGNRTFDGDMINGLLIWHRGITTWPNTSINLDVKEANNVDEAGSGAGSCKNAHLFPGTTNNTAFTPYTFPDSDKKDGTRSGFALTHIKLNGSGASAYISANAYTNFYTGSWSGNVTTNTAWGGNVTVTTNVTVNSGVTLTIDPGSVIKFASGKSLTVNGKLVANSTDPTQRITFTGTTATPGFWNGIKINSGSSSNVSTLRRCDVNYATTGVSVIYNGNTNNVTIDKCRITNNSGAGIFVYGSSTATTHPTIRNNKIQSNTGNGISLQNYAKPKIAINRIEFNGSHGIYATGSCAAKVDSNYAGGNGSNGMGFLSSSNAEVHRNTIVENAGGIYLSSSSNVIANGNGNNKGRNDISNNGSDGIFSSSSSPVFGKDISGQYGNNQILNSAGYQAKQTGTGQLKAERCWWAGNQGDISGNVDNVPYLSSAPSNPAAGWSFSDETYDPSTRVNFNPDWITEGIDIDENASLANPVATDHDAASKDFDPITWQVQFDEAMKQGLEQGEWSGAAGLITELWRELQDARVAAVNYASLIADAENPAVEASIRKYLALTLVEKSLAVQDITTAQNDLENYRQSNPEHDAELLANAGIVNLHFKNDVTAAEKVLAQLSAKTAQNDTAAIEQEKILAEMMANYLQHLGSEPASRPANGAPTVINNSDNSWAVETYPNPFNPETQIRFSLPAATRVEGIIYNVAGQAMRHLVDREFSTGQHTLTWDGRDDFGKTVASGTYFLLLKTGSQRFTRKLLLLR